MKTKLKKVLSTCLAAVMLLSTMLGSSISVGAAVDNDGRYVPSDGVKTNRYYFLMPDDWFNEYTSDAGIYWWDATDAPDSWEDMYKAQKGDCNNVFYVDCPKDVTTIIWTNMLSDGGEFAKLTVNIPLEYYDPDESPLYPDGLPEGFDNMIYVCTNITEVVNEFTGLIQKVYSGDWFYYYGNGKYGTTEEPTTSELTSGDFVYTILDDGTAEIIYYLGSATEVTIPSELDGKKVTSIGWCGFAYHENITSITIPDSVTNIGEHAFEGCTSLESVTIPNSVTYIDEGAFWDCTSLTDVTIPNSVTIIEKESFSGCTSLASITIPDSITEIGYAAFQNCKNLKSVTIPDSVTKIGEYAFGYDYYYKKYIKIGIFKISGYGATEAERYANDNGFEFISLDEPPTKDPELLGDVNADGKVNINDATTIQKSAASLVTLTEKQNKAADVNGDGKVNVNDVTAIQRYVAGIDTGFKIGE